MNWYGGNASFATQGDCNTNQQSSNGGATTPQYSPGSVYGNEFELPLLGGSGGSGGPSTGGSGGGGAILIAASGALSVLGSIKANGGNAYYSYWNGNFGWLNAGDGGAGSGGAIRLVASTLTGTGTLDASGGSAIYGYGSGNYSIWSLFNSAGSGRIRLEGLSDSFSGSTLGATTRGFTGIILLPTNQQPQLAITSIAGQPIPSNPSGSLAAPDIIISGQQANPIPFVVHCSNIPLSTAVSVVVQPATGPAVQASASNNSGTLASSTATVLINMPRGGGIIYAQAVSGLATNLTAAVTSGAKSSLYAQTGLSSSGESFSKMQIRAGLGGSQEIAYITESGKRYSVCAR